MKKLVRKFTALTMLIAASLMFAACSQSGDDNNDSGTPQATTENPEGQEPAGSTEIQKNPTYTITAPEGQENTITIDETAGTITLKPEAEDIEYTISGTFEGQIINKTKGTVLVLNGATLENKNGKAAVYGELKTELKAAKDTVNTITVTGEGDAKAAVHCEKAVEIGGSGALTISCENAHGVKASKVELKGSGTFTFDGGADSSAINCNEFGVKADKSFTANLKDSKNGIKADETIEIASGTFNFTNITKAALKTDTSKDDDANAPKDHWIKITGGTFTFTNCKKTDDTEKNAFTKSDDVSWTENE